MEPVVYARCVKFKSDNAFAKTKQQTLYASQNLRQFGLNFGISLEDFFLILFRIGESGKSC